MRTIGALLAAIAIWAGVQAVTAPDTSSAGTCREYSNSWVVCVPTFSPSGAAMTDMWEDGSATYTDGWVFPGYDTDDTRPVMELDDLTPDQAAIKAAQLAEQGWVRIAGDCNCWTQV